MSVTSHLNIGTGEYDRRIRTFIPRYREMLREASKPLSLLPQRQLTILDLGIGTGALAACCIKIIPNAKIYGLDSDPAMLEVATRRLKASRAKSCTLITGNFLDLPLPSCNVVTAALALHHVKTRQKKQRLYDRCFSALRPKGLLINADCFPPSTPSLARQAKEDWILHMSKVYTPRRAHYYLSAWAREDTYFPLNTELEMINQAGFKADVIWRNGIFGVIVAKKPAK